MTALAAEQPALVPLSEVLSSAPEGQQLAPELECWYENRRWELVGAGERTATLAPEGGGWEGRVLRRHELILVDPSAVRWQAKPPAGHAAFHMDPETRRARSAYLAEANDMTATEGGRQRRDVGPGERRTSTVSDRVCSRGGCGKRLHPANASGECHGCQRICPVCGGPKGANSQTCSGCGSRGGRPRRPATPEPADATPALRSEIAAALAAPPLAATAALPGGPIEPPLPIGPPPAPVILPEAPDAASPPPPMPITTADAVPPLTLDQLPDYVGRLLTQIDRLLERVQEQDAEIADLRSRETARMDVERRVQAVIARSERRS